MAEWSSPKGGLRRLARHGGGESHHQEEEQGGDADGEPVAAQELAQPVAEGVVGGDHRQPVEVSSARTAS